jgi:hypothetical protein
MANTSLNLTAVPGISTVSPTPISPTAPVTQPTSTQPTQYGSPVIGYSTSYGAAANTANSYLANLNKIPSSGISSSAMPQQNSNLGSATSAATSSITGVGGSAPSQYAPGTQSYNNIFAAQNPGSQNGGSSTQSSSSSYGSSSVPQYGNASNSFVGGVLQNLQSMGIQVANAGLQTQLQNANLANQQIQLQYNSDLAQDNAQYSNDYQQLQQQHQNAVGAAAAQIATADPFGVQSSSTNTGYMTKLNNMFTQQANFLNNSYQAQQVALQNGQASAVLSIDQQINTANQAFQQNVFGLLQGTASSLLQNSQFQQTQQTKLLGQFRSTLSSLNLDPSAVQGMSDQQISQTAWGQIGLSAGLTPDQIRAEAGTQTVGEAGVQTAQANTAISAENAATNAQRAQYEGIQTAIAQGNYGTAKTTQYSTYANAISGYNDLKNTLYGSGSQQFTDLINSFLKNPDSNYAAVTAQLGTGGMSIFQAIYGHTPTAAELSSFLGQAAQSSDVRSALLNLVGQQLKNTVGNAITTDSANPLMANSPVLSQLQSALGSLNANPTNSNLPTFASSPAFSITQ